jgi:nucleoid-associated protein YgaU
MEVSTRQSTRLEKAYLTIMSATSGSHSVGPGSKTVAFDFNPKEFTISKDAQWARTDSQVAAEAGPVQWRGPGPRRISGLEVFLDESASATATVLAKTELLLDCCSPTAESIATGKPSGPFVRFSWGHQTGFIAIVTSVSVRYTMFRPNGDPYRAVATLSLEEVDVKTPRQNPTSGGLGTRRSHTLVEGEDLALVAHREYRRPGLWRNLAEANGVDDPMRLVPGRTLFVPPAEDSERDR